MRPVLVTTSPTGGAGGATERLFSGLRRSKINARLVYQGERARDEHDGVIVTQRSILDSIKQEFFDIIPVHRYAGRRTSHFSPQRARNRLAQTIKALDPDVVNLHWVCGSYLSIESVVKLARPVVWTLHDLWPFTGGCHYAEGCERFVDSCGDCPILQSDEENDLSRATWKRKERAWRDVPMTIVTPSRWLADCARRSSLFHDRRIEVIPYGLDLDVFRPNANARAQLELPETGKLLLFGAWENTPRKGMRELSHALRILKESGEFDDLEVVSFGHGLGSEHASGFELHALGHIDDSKRLALAYAAADVFVLPSLEDNLPTTVLEAMASGTPTVGFAIGGVPDMIEDGETGKLADAGDPQALAHAIAQVLNDDTSRARMARNCRVKAEREYGWRLESKRYIELFRDAAQHGASGESR